MAASRRVGPGFRSIADADVLNVANQADDPRSMLSLYRALIRLRRDSEALSIGDVRLLAATEHVLAYERRLGGRARDDRAQHDRGGDDLADRDPAYEFLLSTYLDDPGPFDGDEIRLRADEGLIFRVLEGDP